MRAKLDATGPTLADVTIFMLTILYLVSVLRWTPVAQGFELGSDEGFELMKASLCTNGFRLYDDIWCDQPPIHTVLVVAAFKLFGTSLFAARAVTITCTALLLLSYYLLIRVLDGSILVSMLATLFLLFSPEFLRLSIAAMMIVPGLAFEVLAAALLACYAKSGRCFWLLLSGFTFGIANQIKLTAFLIAPALLCELASCTRANTRSFMLTVLAWAIPASFVTIGIILHYHETNVAMILETHFSRRTYSAFDPTIERAMLHTMLERQLPIMFAAAAGIVSLLITPGKSFLPIILFFTTYIFHLIHRPFWPFYATHFALSLSWLAAVGLVDLTRRAANQIQHEKSLAGMYAMVVLPIIGTLLLFELPPHARDEMVATAATHNVDEDDLVKELRAVTKPGEFILAENVIYAFHAGLLVDPALAVPSEKRIASGQLDIRNYVRFLKDRRSRAAILRTPIRPEIKTALDESYVIDYRSETFNIYIRKEEPDSEAQPFPARIPPSQQVKNTSQRNR